MALCTLVACAGKPPSVAPQPAPTPLHLVPLTDLVASAGLEWLVVIKPPELLRSASLGQPIETLLPRAKLDSLANYLGFDARLADDIAIASYRTSTLYFLRVAHDPALVEAKFRGRLTGEIERAVEGSQVVRVSGVLGKTHRAMADLEQSVLVFEVGEGGLLRAAVAFAQEKLHRAKPVLHAEPLFTLAKRMGSSPALLFVPNPVASPWSQGAHGLLARATALGLALTPAPAGLSVRGLALGAWDDPPSEALHRLEQTVQEVINSPLGHLTGLQEPLVPYASGGDRDGIRFEGVVDGQKLADGLHAATSAELRELFPSPP